MCKGFKHSEHVNTTCIYFKIVKFFLKINAWFISYDFGIKNIKKLKTIKFEIFENDVLVGKSIMAL